MDIFAFMVSGTATVLEALQQLDNNGHGILFLCEDERIKGVVSDGDVRRYMLRNGDMGCAVSKIANYHPYTIAMDAHVDSQKFMREKQITALPIIDKRGRIIRIDFDNGVKVFRTLDEAVPVVIMAGGKGSRLYPYTNILPKPLIPIGDKTITEHIMERFEQVGCNRFYMVVNYKKNLIRTFFQETGRKEDIRFVDEETFLGTGGGLRLLLGKVEGTFFMTNCDILVEEDYRLMLEYHREHHNIATMICAKKEVEMPYGTVETDEEGRAVSLSEKPRFRFLTNTGLYVLEPEFLERIPEDTFIHITDVIQDCIDRGERVGVYTVGEEAWLDMGQMDELHRMKRKLEMER